MDNDNLSGLNKRNRIGIDTPEEIARLYNSSVVDSNADILRDHTDEQLKNIEVNMFLAIKSEIHKHEQSSRKPIFLRPLFYQVAATLLILVVASLWWYRPSTQLEKVQTAFGEQRIITLPDQSKVILNSNSVLRYASHWDEKSTREVWIEGEGFFSVVHTKNHQKFVVHGVDDLNVEVLGTKFNINTRPTASEVMLTEGKVKLKLSGDDNAGTLFLKPGELATVKNKKLSAKSVSKERYTSWLENRLFFERTPLSEISVLLKNLYGLKVIFLEPELESRELSGEISAATADEILYAIGEALDLKVEKKGKSVSISSESN